jgi:hypothetical protein
MKSLRAIICVFCLASVSGIASVGLAASVAEIAHSYPDGGGYEWKGTGVPEAIRFGEATILDKGKSTYCSGFTFAVVMKAAAERGILKGQTAEQVRAFQKEWYGSTKESGETQCAYALEKLGIGKEVKAADAREGDFLQLWRTNKSGHSVVFLDWVTDGSKRIGLKYRSSQKSTDGIGDRVEYFAGTPGKKGLVDPKRIYFGRLNPAVKKSIRD